MTEEFEVSKPDQINLLNKTSQYFKSKDHFEKEEFEREIFNSQELIDSFDAYTKDPGQLPAGWQEHGYSDGESAQARQICDFIAGMTDRYALDEHKRLFDLDPLFR